jgi:hypothetical protein
MLAHEMKVARVTAGFSCERCGLVLDMTGEAYRMRERDGRMTGAQLALLARAYGSTVSAAFPSYKATEGEILLCRDLAA